MFNMQVNLIVTNKVRERILEWSKDEHTFFAMQKSFDIHIEKRTASAQGETAVVIYFDNETNKVLANKLDGRIVILDCIVKYDGLLATNIRAVHGNFPLKTNRRFSTKLQFVTKPNNSAGMPIDLHTKIRELPIAEERSEYVKKRISSWEGYLKIQERNATIEDMTASFTQMDVNADFSRMTLVCKGLKNDEWNKLKGLSVNFKGSKDSIGDVLKVNIAKKTVEIELRGNIQELVRKNKLNLKTKDVVFSNFATLSQIRRLRKGFADLEKGLAANANLEKILFEDRPRIRAPKERLELEFHNPLNEFQRQAVIGAMTAEDLYVIQGPPGTGKTTVISEICQQNAKVGLRTLVASQSNLAVDNALSRLLSNKEIRILRFGRTESIEEEGKKFIEENVGKYWLEQTLNAIKHEIAEHTKQQDQLEEQIITCKNRLQTLDERKVQLKEKIQEQEHAKIEYDEVEKIIQHLKKTLGTLKKERQQLEETLTDAQNEEVKMKENMQVSEQLLTKHPSVQVLREKLQHTEQLITQTSKQIIYRQTTDELAQLEQSLQTLREDYLRMQQQTQKLQHTIDEVMGFSKIEQLTNFIQRHNIPTGYVISSQLDAIDKLKLAFQMNTQWKDVNDRLHSAIQYLEGIIGQPSYIPPATPTTFTIQEIDQTIQQLKQWLLTNGISSNHQQLKVYLNMLYVRRQFVWQQGEAIQNTRQEIFKVFAMLKKEVAEQVNLAAQAHPSVQQSILQKSDSIKVKMQHLQTTAAELRLQVGSEDVPTLNILNTMQQTQQKELDELQQTLQHVQQAVLQVEEIKPLLLPIEELVQNTMVSINELEQKIKQVNAEGLQQETKLKQLAEILQPNYVEQLEKVTFEWQEYTEQMVLLKQQIKKLPVKQAIQLQWQALLEDANEHDLDEIRKLYVQHANVIGTTCVASARKEFMDNYPTFDVVIIDEVSKATPPELLLPMLKGKKIILVGDHHQLPPLVGEDTLEETLKAMLEENKELEGRDELKKLLKESLFERLFKNLPRSNKQMLAIQYRMHEKIMHSISPFYENEDDHLQCGLTDSDKVRDHLLESHYVKRQDHLIWLDMPNEKRFFEEQMKDGKSRFNQAELDVIRDVLIDLDHATDMAKHAGLMAMDMKKSVGVISFYGEQVKKIDRLVQQQLNLKHLHIRTGTVDKFQGMEMDVIVVSMVRNNDHKNADIGFANDYRRLNVALSRARELLMLIGSTKMFAERAKQPEARAMYSRLLETVKTQNGLRSIEGAVVQ